MEKYWHLEPCRKSWKNYYQKFVEKKVCRKRSQQVRKSRKNLVLLFQIPAAESSSQHCFSCARTFEATRDINLYQCPDCRNIFCCDCDIFIHEALHSCPGCSSTPQLAAVNQTPQPTQANSLYLSHAVSNFYGTEIEISAGFGLVLGCLAVLKNKFGSIISNFWGRFFTRWKWKKNQT